MLKRNAVGALHSSLHIWSERGSALKGQPTGGGRGRGLCRRSTSQRQSVTAMVARATALPSLPAVWGAARRRSATCFSEGRGRGTRGGGGGEASAESHRPRWRDPDWRKLGKEQGRRRRIRSAGSQLPPAAGERRPGGGVNRSKVWPPARWQLVHTWRRVCAPAVSSPLLERQ